MVILEMTRISLHAMHEGFSLKGLFMRDIESIKTLLETSVYNKPYLSCEEQLVLLEYRGVRIENKNLLWNN